VTDEKSLSTLVVFHPEGNVDDGTVSARHARCLFVLTRLSGGVNRILRSHVAYRDPHSGQ
jgi:hypothetical protein